MVMPRPESNADLNPAPTFNLRRAIEHAKAEVYRRFPEMTGREPKYLARRIKSRPIISRYLIFRTTLVADNGERLAQTVRVYLTPRGEIARMIVSKGPSNSAQEEDL